MKVGKLKILLKHIISEMIANKDVEPDVFGAVNIGEDKLSEDIDPRLSDIVSAHLKEMGKFEDARLLKYSNNIKELYSYLRENVFFKDAPTAQFIDQCMSELRGKAEEQTGTGAVAGFSPPFTGGPRRRKKRKVNESNFVNKVKERIRTSVNTAKTMANEKTNPDGTYSDDMEDPTKTNRIMGLAEETSSGAVFSGGPTIQTPAWGTRNREGSPRAIAASKSLGYKPVKSISTKEKKI